MPENTAIEWTDSTWNPVTGCTKVSPGCKFCYAERIAERRGDDFSKIVLHPDRLARVLQWRMPRRVFVNSMSDLFHEAVPDDFIEQVFDVMLQAEHIFQVLTKRSERMAKWVTQFLSPALLPAVLENIWFGVSVETPRYYDRIDWLRKTPAVVRFLSLEPLLAPMPDLPLEGISWVIVGGESGGPAERALVEQYFCDTPCPEFVAEGWCRCSESRGTKGPWWPKPDALEWIRSILNQCQAAGVAFFFKDWGGPRPKSGGRLLDGKEWNDYPCGAVSR